MNGHHLILGDIKDYITGETIRDTLDERYRQNVARLLVEEKGFMKADISPRAALNVRAGEKCAIIAVDFKITLSNRIHMIVRYGPGSIVTRHRPALAASRLMAAYQIPIVVVTNGEAAEILEGASGSTLFTGLDAIPTRTELLAICSPDRFAPIPKDRSEMEARILYAYDVDGSCPCDDTICRIEPV